jgi:hypothetical protein
MKFMKLASAAAAVMTLTLLTGVVAPASHAEVSFDFFYSDLSPHGSWYVSGQYGHVWRPAVYRPGWNPYHDGHWVYTDCGWTWVSDYGWGDVAYHYGTWVEDPRYGWVWVPGYTWAPAWVTFRTGPDYIGWAPVPPSFSVGFSTRGFGFGASIPIASSAFVFVPTRNFAAPRIRNYVVPDYRRTTIINNTTIVNNLTIQNNVVINRGPDMRTIERATRRTFTPQPIEQVARVSPFTNFRRDQITVARGDRVRAAEPISAQQSLPPKMSEQARREYRRNPQLNQAPRNDRFRTPTETEAQLQPDRRPQRQPQQDFERQRPQNQRQERAQQDRRQQEIQQQRDQQIQQEQRQREQPQRAQPRRDQQQREQQVQQPNQRQQERATSSPRQEKQQQQPQKPSKRTPKKKTPEKQQEDNKDKQDSGGGNS